MEDHIDADGEPRVKFSWEDLTVHQDTQGDTIAENIAKKVFRIPAVNRPIRILDSVTGHAEGGSLVAIMGPSGSGKTTLLAALARRIEVSSGNVKINGCSVSRNAMSKISGYLPQFYAMPSALTAMEYMLFSCALRLDKRTSSKERNALANGIFSQLGLLESGDTQVSKLSGGETKRLSLALELVTKPEILFLDEPTTGLDTWTAMRVVESARAEAQGNGTLVFCSIHQPAMDIYKMFSHAIILANGRTAYYGTLENATKFFNSKGFHCPESFNEAEYYVKVVSTGDLVDSLNPGERTPWKPSGMTRRRQDAVELDSQTSKPNQFVQFYWVTWRIFAQMRRTMFEGITQHLTFLSSATLISIFYYGVNPRSQSGIQDIKGALYLVSSEIIFQAAYSVVYVMPHEMPLYLRENSMYGPGAYYIGTIIGMIPKAVFYAMGFISMMFFALDLNPSFLTFALFSAYAVLATIASSAYGTLASSWIENSAIATTIMAPIDLISFTMAGVFYNIRSMPPYLSWVRYLSIFYYTNEAFAIIHWTTVDHIECYPDEDLPCLKTGRQVLAEYGYDEFNLWIDACGLLLLTLVLHVLGYLGVKRRRLVKPMY